jgi:flagellar secretion chaperone FliS
MTHQPRTEYLKTQVMTASPETLQLMLWDGAIRFAEQGKEAILKKEIEASYNALLRSQKIVMEMSSSLRRDVDPDLCTKLAALYNFIYRRLVDANLKKDPHLVDDAVQIMRHQRETWSMVVEQLAEKRAAEAKETVQENAQAIETAEEISQSARSVARPAGGVKRPYQGLAAKVATPSLSVQG